ncbi:MAG: HAD family phosphatase [Candidatus Kapaibacterium sp.]|nr:MAG: HAD family phosphatase [Candidatus Kapabacteria bacterium]
MSLHTTFEGISTIVFDLGGVLYNVEYSIVEQEFSALAKNGVVKNGADTSSAEKPSKALTYTRQTQPELLSQYEIGAISTADFYAGLRKDLHLEGDDAALAAAWNAMLLGVYPGRNALVWRLKQKYKLAMLSNTNELHINHVRPECQELFSLFDKLFFSYEMGLRKPDAAIFHKVLEEMGCKPDEILFIDDSHQHIEAARALGIRTLWLQHPDSLELAVEMLLGLPQTA